jgi:putative ABC transport system substrate-binding protein
MRIRLASSALALALLAAPLAAEAQLAGKMPHIGILAPSMAYVGRVDAIRHGLRDLGYVEGQNIIFQVRYVGKEVDTPHHAAELVRQQVDVIVTASSSAIQPAMRATTSIPIVMVADNADPVDAGYIASYARPGGNVTGLAGLSPDVTAKRMELLKDTVPDLSRVAVLRSSASPGREGMWADTVTAARTLGLRVHALDIMEAGQLDALFDDAARERAGGLIVIRDPLTNTLRARIIELAARRKIPAMYATREFVDAGGLMAYGSNVLELYRRTASYADRILRGLKPADLPVERPTRFELVINLKTAKALGLTIPPAVLARADEVIQ